MRKTPLKRTNPVRKAKQFARAYGGEGRVGFVKRLPCSVLGCMATPSEHAHAGEKAQKGAHYKSDADTIVPLCAAHHTEFDASHEASCRSFFFAVATVVLAYASRIWRAT